MAQIFYICIRGVRRSDKLDELDELDELDGMRVSMRNQSAAKPTLVTLFTRYHSQAHRESASFARGQVISPICGH